MANKSRKYILCKRTQNKEDGRLIETSIDISKCKGFEDFMKKLHKAKEISDEELEAVDCVYYA